MKECTETGDKLRYNYFIIGAFDDYIRLGYQPLTSRSDVYLPESPIGKAPRLLRALHKLHWSAKLNAKIRLPMKRIWFKKMCRHSFDSKKPICYVFIGGQYIAGNRELRDYIRSLNPENRIVILFGDLIAKKHYKDFEAVRNSADILITYDKKEAETYGILCCGSRQYNRLQEVTEPDRFDTDVYFLGYAKDRLDTIMEVYRYLTENGLKCRFDLAEVPADRQQPLEGISYISGIPYQESVRRLNKAKCVLEVCQKGSDACTKRMVESVVYHRLLLTNADVVHSEYYIPQTMLQFHEASDIDIEALKRPIPYGAFSEANHSFSPVQKLLFIDNHL